ncbi:MAG: DNA translocase FtsK [Betaproteobacteria bacterium]|nr:DNA translocase FtsK [Betaproteobacteria bacterium]
MALFSDSSTKRRRAATRRKPSAATSQVSPVTEALLADLSWIGLLSFGVFLALSLVSFSSQDSAWFQYSSSAQVHNWLGRAGALLADVFLFFFGASSCWWVLLCLVFARSLYLRAVQIRQRQKLSRPDEDLEGPWNLGVITSQFFGFLLFLSFSCALEAQRLRLDGLFVDTFAGGALGSFVGGALEWALGATGLTLVATLGLFMSLSVFLRFSWLGLFEATGQGAEGLLAFVQARAQAWQDRKLGESTAEERAERVMVKKRLRPEPTLEVRPVASVAESASLSKRPQVEQQALFAELRRPEAGLPPLSLLEPVGALAEPVAAETLTYTSRLIETRLADFGVQVRVVSAQPGPVVTRYEIEPALGVKGSQVVNLSRDLARALSLSSVRVVETIPGKSLMGLELPNARRQTVRLSEILGSQAFQDSGATLPMALGKDISGAPFVVDLAKMPHLLVAGTTGSGKSVGVNAMLLSLLYHAPAEHVRLILIDPKMLEFSVYEGIPHLLTPVVTDMKLAAQALHWCVGEMERRYRLMSQLNTRNLAGFNHKVEEALRKGQPIANPLVPPEMVTAGQAEMLEPLPQIVVVIDELADLMMVVGKKVEELIARLAQKARAAGIHLILATQRPSVDVITGLIKANIPARISFQVSSKIDSRTVLDQMGAEALLGMGDMLFLSAGSGVPTRVHGAFVADEEVVRLANWLREQSGGPQYDERILEGADPQTSGTFTAGLEGVVASSGEGEGDALYDEAVAVVLKHRRASISLVQRHLRIGYNRAARLLEAMEQAGVVSAMQSNGNRDILVPAGRE